MKKLIVLRGVPGSGKSTKARLCASEWTAANNKFGLQPAPQVFSTDDFFMKDGKYCFNPAALGHAHCWNANRTFLEMMRGVPLVIVDNTNTQAWECKPYIQAAVLLGYEVEFVQPDTPWAFDAEECAKRNTHGVPVEAIRGMIARWEKSFTVEDVLKSCAPWEKK